MKLFVITLFVFSILGISTSFAMDSISQGPELERKTIIKKPPHGDDGTGGNGEGGKKPILFDR